MPEQTDHENILLLTKAVDNLGKRLDEKLLELKADIRELKDNYANRLENAEQQIINIDKAKVAKEEQDKINGEFIKRISSLENWRWYILGIGSILIYLINHFFGK